VSQPRPVTPDLVVTLLTDLITETADAAVAVGAGRVRVAVDGADAAHPGPLADALAERLRERGLPAIRVRARDFLRPASLRYEYGHTDPESYASGWLDVGALTREVLAPLAPNGTGRYVPTLWDQAVDRATRAPYELAPARAAVLVDGPLLLRHGLPFDLAIHLHLGEAALRRRTPSEDAWTLAAFDRYAAETDPQSAADVTVRVDDPRRPAVILRSPARRTSSGSA
jgi:hypothetical protein